MTQKDLATILYQHYRDNECESDYSYDDNELSDRINARYEELRKADPDLIESVEDNIEVREEEGTDYDVLYISSPIDDTLEVQVTSMIDYDGNGADGYEGDCNWCDVGMFLIDKQDVDYDNLDDEKEYTIDKDTLERE